MHTTLNTPSKWKSSLKEKHREKILSLKKTERKSESKIRDFFAQTGNKVEHLLNVTQEHKVVIVVENAD